MSTTSNFIKKPRPSLTRKFLALWKGLHARCSRLKTPRDRSRGSSFLAKLCGRQHPTYSPLRPKFDASSSDNKPFDTQEQASNQISDVIASEFQLLSSIQLQEECGKPIERRAPRKKALLIAIQYKDNPVHQRLNGLHKRALDFEKVLIDLYGYKKDDIVTLMDDPSTQDSRRSPTDSNMFREMNQLVKGAQSGDRFVFYFAGHGVQIPNKTHTEDDGMDEAIVPVNDKDWNKVIIDNSLNDRLVRPLPAGSTLTAIFDTCTSGSILDLRHDQCNRVYEHQPSIPVQCEIHEQPRPATRRCARGLSLPPDPTGDDFRVPRRSSSLHPMKASCISELAIQTEAVIRVDGGEALVPVEQTAVSASDASRPSGSLQSAKVVRPRRSTVKMEMSVQTHQTHNLLHDTQLDVSIHHEQTLTWKPFIWSGEICTSPEPFDRPCDGSCKPDPSKYSNIPTIICISSCEDGKLSWQNGRGESITSALVGHLRKDQNQTRRQVMKGISFWVHDMDRRRHQWFLARIKGRCCGGQNIKQSFQNPQISSNQALDLDAPFEL